MKLELKIINKEFYTEHSLLPKYATDGSAALDLICTRDMVILTNEVREIRTGLAIALDSSQKDVAALILPRSGLGTKGLVLANTAGLIDGDYRNELIVQAWNRNKPGWDGYSINIKAGERFAQLLIIPIIRAEWNVVEEFSTSVTNRTGGFGHTGS